jgi:hypothetical protein
VIVAPSCSLLHTPIDLARENALDPEVKDWLAFAVQKVAELAVLARALNDGRASVRQALDAASASVGSRRTSGKINDPAVKARTEAADPSLTRRSSAFEIRRKIQRDKLNLPPYPTTTIGSFPQTPEIRKARADHGKLLVAGFSDRWNWAMRRRNGGFPRRAVAASGQTGQDKLAELREARFRRRACRQLTFCDVDADSKRL